MLHHSVRRLRILPILVALALATVTVAASGTASAATCVPHIVEYAPQSQTPLLIQCPDGTNYLARRENPNIPCTEQSLDTIKIWLSMAQAALLAGKKLNIITTMDPPDPNTGENLCNPATVIQTIDLQR